MFSTIVVTIVLLIVPLVCSVVVREDKKLLTVLFPDGRDGRAFTLKVHHLWLNIVSAIIMYLFLLFF